MTDGPPGTWQTDAARIRLVLTRELETISVYEALAREAESPEAESFFEHLAKEEKEHVAEATWLLRKFDADQDTDFDKSYSEAHFKGEVPSTPATPEGTTYIPEGHRLPSDPRHTLYALPAAPSPTAGTFTVGTLKQRR